MKQQVVASMAGLMLMTSGWETLSGKPHLGTFTSRSKSRQADAVTFEDVGEKNIHGKWQGKNAPTLYDGGFFARADFLYWRADEGDLQYGLTQMVLPTGIGARSKVHTVFPKVTWDPGFRVGIGYTFSRQDYWDLIALWTHFQTDQSDQRSFIFNDTQNHTVNFLVPWWGSTILGATADKASVHWKLTYNVYDLNLGRDYFVAKTFSLHPFIGVRGATIDQNYHAKYRAIVGNLLIPTFFRAKSDFWGIGAHLGTGLQWHCTKSFSFIGQVGGSLLYGDFQTTTTLKTIIDITGTTLPVTAHDDRTTGAANLEAMLGIQWEKFFHQNKYRFLLSLGYEWNQWYAQNQFIRANNVAATISPTIPASVPDRSNGDLTLQGATLQVRLDF